MKNRDGGDTISEEGGAQGALIGNVYRAYVENIKKLARAFFINELDIDLLLVTYLIQCHGFSMYEYLQENESAFK